MNRRDFLIQVSSTAGAFALAVEIPTFSAFAAAPAGDEPFRPNAWLRISPDNSLNFVLDRVEMGQGTMTSLPMLLAEELDVAPEDLRIEFAPAAREYVNPNLALQMTGGSTSVASAWNPLRKAGATARAMLVQAAAERWGVAVAACVTKQGIVYHRANGLQARYGELALAAARLPVPAQVPLKDPKDYTIIGKPRTRLDAALKSSGRAPFGIDVSLPDLRVAVVKRPPAFGGTVKSFDAAAALKMPGVETVVQIPSGVAVVARRFWQAKAAAEAVVIDWDPGPHARLSSEAILATFTAAAKQRSDKFDAPGAAKTLFAEYQIPYLAHAAMEPGNCTAHVTDTGCDIWAPTQAPGLAQQLAAEITGFAHKDVRVHTTFLGGGFGRRLYQDFVVEAVELAKRLKYPVKIQWTREDDIRHDVYRPASVHHLQGGLDADGQLIVWNQTVVSQSILAQCLAEWVRAIVPAWLPQGLKSVSGGVGAGLFEAFAKDPSATEGASDMDYAVAAHKVEFLAQDLPVPVGFWRSVGHSYTGFVVESFIDELAHAAGKDPVAFRRSLLKENKKALGVLDLAAAKAGWDKPLPPGLCRGVAVHSAFGSCTAQVAEVSIGIDGIISVARVVCAVDCGRAIDPDGVEAQIQGAIMFGLSAALYGEITIKDGAVVQSNFHDYQVLRLTEAPTIEVHIVPSESAPTGVGEPGVTPLAAAVANAVFAGTGKRLRRLPLTLPPT